MSITGIYAASYSYTQSDTVSSSVGSAKVKCSATYYSSGNTRWNRSWGTVSTNGLKATYISSTMTIPSDPYMNTTGTISMTNYNYKLHKCMHRSTAHCRCHFSLIHKCRL